jgi:hypothetical protein
MYDHRSGMQVLRAARVYEPAIVKLNGLFYLFSGDRMLGRGLTIKQALNDGEFLPVPEKVVIPYVAEGLDVRKGGEHVAIAKTRNGALRIANALNRYVPGKQGY